MCSAEFLIFYSLNPEHSLFFSKSWAPFLIDRFLINHTECNTKISSVDTIEDHLRGLQSWSLKCQNLAYFSLHFLKYSKTSKYFCQKIKILNFNFKALSDGLLMCLQSWFLCHFIRNYLNFQNLAKKYAKMPFSWFKTYLFWKRDQNLRCECFGKSSTTFKFIVKKSKFLFLHVVRVQY